MKQSFLFAGALLALNCTVMSAAHAQADVAALKAAAAAPSRTPAFVARDAARHPVETLAFFGIKPTDTVVELSPGGGWYTEILAPYLRERGQLVVGGEDPEGSRPGYARSAVRFKQKLEATPAVYDKVQLSIFDATSGKLAYAKPGSADAVLTFRNIHNWVTLGDAQTLAVFKSIYDTLKPGGILGVEEHRRPASQPQDEKAKSGYLHVSYVVALAERAGFKLAGSSEINANPKDTADHPEGVWTLPPTLTLKDKDRERYEAIGESDRMTLKFVKPK